MYVGSSAVSPDGTLKWMVAPGSTDSSPAIGADGTLYVGISDNNQKGELLAVNPDGSSKWALPLGTDLRRRGSAR